MRKFKIKNNKGRAPLKVVKSISLSPYQSKLINAAWIFSQAALWNCTVFSSTEIQAARSCIRDIFRLSSVPKKAFLSFCQRVVMARELIASNDAPSSTLPSIWLRNDSKSGYASTKDWYGQVKKLRESIPFYRNDLKALAEAALDIIEEPTQSNFLYWKNYFIERLDIDSLQIFQAFTTNLHYNAVGNG